MLSQPLDGVDDIGAHEPAVPAELDARQHAAPGVVAHGRAGEVQKLGDLVGGQQLIEPAWRASWFGVLGGVQPLRVDGHRDVLSSRPARRPPGTVQASSSTQGPIGRCHRGLLSFRRCEGPCRNSAIRAVSPHFIADTPSKRPIRCRFGANYGARNGNGSGAHPARKRGLSGVHSTDPVCRQKRISIDVERAPTPSARRWSPSEQRRQRRPSRSHGLRGRSLAPSLEICAQPSEAT